MFSSEQYEKLGAFYLGQPFDIASRTRAETPVMYPSKQLLTHAVIVGMTGSGKTGLGTVLLEEAAIDGLPSLVIDPKGDLTNLLLTFPDLRPEELLPWLAAGDDPEKAAARIREGLTASGQSPERIRSYANAVERVLFTPGSSAARNLSLLPSLAPPNAGANTEEIIRERAVAVAFSLLNLAGLDVDAASSAELSLVATVLEDAWTRAVTVDAASLLRAIAQPPFAQLGALDVNTVIDEKARRALVVRLNTALSSPAMRSVREGEPLDIASLLWRKDGKPRMAILSIAHLGDNERMFFVSTFLIELISWMRTQPGTTSLRALLYMDEVFGYLPPVANPPSKTPMLTLLKQARAFGIGVVLATQNPVDVDYKALSNAGTWLIGRLQAERDKARLLDGLEGASKASATEFSRDAIDSLISSLEARTFLLHSVHENAPQIFQSRYALSLLRGPMTREEMQRIAPVVATEAKENAATAWKSDSTGGARPLAPAGISERFLAATPTSTPTRYQAGHYGKVAVHYVDSKATVDAWVNVVFVSPLLEAAGTPSVDHANAWVYLNAQPDFADAQALAFAALPAKTDAKTFAAFGRALLAHVYAARPLYIWVCDAVDAYGQPLESEASFRGRLDLVLREKRDQELAKIAAKYQTRIDRAEAQLAARQQRANEASSNRTSEAIAGGLSVGISVLGAVLGGRRSVTVTLSKGITAAKRTAAKQAQTTKNQEAVGDAEENLETLKSELDAASNEIRANYAPERLQVTQYPITAKKADLRLEESSLVWVPA